ncbi:hypothetical protein FOMPIDRAFT_1019466 [Fomitopsis schrenkii]|uniref:Uncharacterized protein n=1 Tax=Fomitopsis schrenkii TaxID=2126942 RepID=S8DW28_FOMSC|nr:hypothetical protein FOMPIDRAFT_1019466 [Fomitopsis schrenkii]
MSSDNAIQVALFGNYILSAAADVCILYAFWGAASALRVYAISGRQLLFPVLVALFSSVPIATNIYSMTTLFPVVTSAPGTPADNCVYFSSTPIRTQQTGALTKICSSFADALVLFLAEDWQHENALFTSAAVKLHYGSGAETTVLVMVLTTICLSRLLLNLRKAAYAPQDTDSSSNTTGTRSLSTVEFSQRVVGALANSVDDGLSGSDDEDCGGEVEELDEGGTGEVQDGGTEG